jgi:hypothetical protein
MLYTNADSLNNKLNELQAISDLYSPKVICISETLPKSNVSNIDPNQFIISGYTGYHTTTGRGVSIFVSSDLKAEEIEPLNTFNDAVALKLSLPNNKVLIILCIYRSPSSSEANNLNLLELLQKANNLPRDYLIITGDFNLKEVDWKNKFVHARPSHMAYLTYDLINDLFLDQLVTEPTRHRSGEQANTLDWLITDSSDLIDNISINAPLGERGDHNVISFEFSAPSVPSTQTIKRNLYKGNYETMAYKLNQVDWVLTLKDCDCEKAWDIFLQRITEIIEEEVPVFKHKSKNRKLWMNKETRLAIKDKNKAWNKYKKHKTQDNWESFTKCRNLTNRKVNNQKSQFEKKIADEIKTNPKQFWNYVNSKKIGNRDFPTMYDAEGRSYTEDTSKAELFNNYFASVFTLEDIDTTPSIHSAVQESISSVEITPKIVLKYLNKINISKAAGPDDLHPKILYELRENIKVPLSIIFNLSLSEGRLPISWKQAIVKPIFKKGKKDIPSNYRPVSLTAICCKILERIIRDKLVEHLETNNLLSLDQHGFRTGCSCTTQLLEVMETWSKYIDEGLAFDVIYLDFAKAFDKVPHVRLCKKVESFGILGQLLAWITNFLQDRSQSVVINTSKSNPKTVSSGIPQGSVLGPLLFIIFINDLPSQIDSTIKIFADDTKIFRAICNSNDSATLQDDLNKLINWSQNWLLPFNTKKCIAIHYGHNNPNNNYSLNNDTLNIVDTEKDLGVTFDNQLKFSPHIRNIVAKANSRVGLIRRNFSTLSPQIFLPLYKTLCRPLLEYASCIWNPTSVSDINEIEKVQRRATKFVVGNFDLPYSDRLKRLNLDSLKFRRRRYDIIQVFRIVNGFDNLKVDDFFDFHDGPNTRGHPLKLKKPRARGNSRLHSFSHRIINDWNNLSNTTVSKTSINAFKTALKSEWANHPDRYLD